MDNHPQSSTASPSEHAVGNEILSESDISENRRALADKSNEHEQNEVYLSVVWSGNKLGAAFYDIETTQINILTDALENDDFHLLKTVIHQVQPSCIVTSSKQDDRLLAAIRHETTTDNEENESFQLLPSIDYSLEICKRRILSLELPDMPKHLSDEERVLYLSSLIPMDHANMMRAIGGLIKLLDKLRVGIELEESDTRVPILAIKTFSLDGLMAIDENTYSALQIFQHECHPSVYKAATWSSTKEGLSLYAISRASSYDGKLRTWFLRPLKSRPELEARLDAVAFFSNHRNMEAMATIQNCLKHIKNLAKVLVRMRDAQATTADWQALYKTVYNAIYIADVCRGQPQSVDIFKKISIHFTDDLQKIANQLSKIVDFEESTVKNRFVVKPNVDPELDKKKRTFNGLPDLMTRVAKEEMSTLNDDVTECTVVYLPQLGYLLAVPETEKLKQNNYELSTFTFLFMSNGTAHYRTEKVQELDEKLGDTECEISDHETSIMLELQNMILEHTRVLLNVMTYAAQLDCLITLAICAKEGNYVRPHFTDENFINVKAARHPLQELCCSPFVPNDIHSGAEHGKMKILTGPNASGKSVYLKQVALVVFMAQIGSFVPAECATLGLMDGIYTRIRTMESVSVGLSTFMIDINQVSRAVRHGTESSLVILDEFGKGTDSTDGQALLCATLTYWLRHQCPHVFVSTHYHSVIQHQYLPPSPLIKYQTLEVLEQGPELVFLYQLIDGTANSSYACHVAALAGLPREMLSRASEVSELIKKNQPVRRVDTASTAEQYQKCQQIVEKFYNLDLDKEEAVTQFLRNDVLPAREFKL